MEPLGCNLGIPLAAPDRLLTWLFLRLKYCVYRIKLTDDVSMATARLSRYDGSPRSRSGVVKSVVAVVSSGAGSRFSVLSRE